MATGFSFADDPQISVREKIERYFQLKNRTAMNTVPVLDESTSDESLLNSFSGLVRFQPFYLDHLLNIYGN